jgi:hypothetical protein
MSIIQYENPYDLALSVESERLRFEALIRATLVDKADCKEVGLILFQIVEDVIGTAIDDDFILKGRTTAVDGELNGTVQSVHQV